MKTYVKYEKKITKKDGIPLFSKLESNLFEKDKRADLEMKNKYSTG